MKTQFELKRAPILVGLVLVISASGCDLSRRLADADPQFSDMVVNGESIPEVNRIVVPMPAAIAAPVLKRAEASSLWQSAAKSLFLDQRAEAVGDILTIIIDIDDKAQLKNASERARAGSQKEGFPVFLGYGSQVEKALPGVAASDLPTGGQIVDLGSSSSSTGEGSIKRNEAIELKIAAMVMQRLPNGNFIIAGRQEVRVNNELRELRVAGIIRPVDITTKNTISYEKIAEARITYGGRGQISQVQRPRSGANLLDIILPY